jgi:Tfp pilus assembly protein PilF
MNKTDFVSEVTSSMSIVTSSTAPPNASHPRQRIAQNFLLVWLDLSIDESRQDCQNTLAQFRSVVNDVNIFTNQDECIDFLTEVDDTKVFLIIETTIGQLLISLVHDIPQLDTIYILCENKFEHEQWTKDWAKIKGIHTDIESTCEALQLATKQCNQDSIVISFITVDEETTNSSLNQLEPSFMYTQIFKEILLEMEHDEQSVKILANYCRTFYNGNIRELNIIDEFERNYRSKSPIWWYTRECFTFQMLNRALRTLEGDTIIKMGSFIHDLHQHIQALHQEQVGSCLGKTFRVYRGQGLSTTDFEKLQKTKGVLMSFNNFLSTSKNHDVSLRFAKRASTKANMVGILFEMTIDPSISLTPFASIQGVSFYSREEEILFSMHSVFRVGEIIKIDSSSPLYQVNLKLTSDNDQQLRALTERIRKEVAGERGWTRLGLLLAKIGQFDKAEVLFNTLLEQTSDLGWKAVYYNNIGCINDHQGNYKKAIENYKKGLEIWRRIFPPDCAIFAAAYSNIGLLYDNMGEYSEALSFFKKGLEIDENYRPNHPDLAISYNNIGTVYRSMKDYSKALSFFEKALEIDRKFLPSNHPDFATSYNNIGLMYSYMSEYSKALPFCEKALEIQEKTLPITHPHLAICYDNIGEMYRKMREYPKALSFLEKALKIREKTLPPTHPYLAECYSKIGDLYMKMEEYSKAVASYNKALEIKAKIIPLNHLDLVIFYNNIGTAYANQRKYAKALPYLELAQNIWQRSLSSDHPYVKGVQTNIDYIKMKLKTNVQ